MVVSDEKDIKMISIEKFLAECGKAYKSKSKLNGLDNSIYYVVDGYERNGRGKMTVKQARRCLDMVSAPEKKAEAIIKKALK